MTPALRSLPNRYLPRCARTKRGLRVAVLAALAATAGPAALAQGQQAGQSTAPSALVDFSLEQLSDLVVSSVSRQDTRLAEAPASIYLISGADIRRAGATNLADALRLAPNLQVAQSDSRNWAVTARGFSSVLENKMLVLVDGRSIYSPLFSGVFWDTQDVLMEDVERIEVISGPGATIWGANAVNGVINIITRNAADTQGNLLVASSGNRNRLAAARHGGSLGNGGAYRLYAQFHDGEPTTGDGGAPAVAGWQRRQAGMRADWDGARHNVTISGDVYQGTLDNTAASELRQSGANLLGRITSVLDNGSQLRLQAYLDHVERNQELVGSQALDTFDMEAQHSVRLGGRNHLTWGGGYRLQQDRFENGPQLHFTPAKRLSHLGNVFAQDEIALRPALKLTAGLRFEHNDYTGWEALPNLHLGWNVDSNQLLWAGISRTVRAPSRIDRDFMLFSPGGTLAIAGGPDVESETARVLELGYRGQASATLSYSATAFYSDYRRLRTLEPGVPGPQFRNLGAGNVRGVELWGRWQLTPGWRLSSGLVLQDVRTRLLAGSQDASGINGLATNDPSNYWSLRSSHDLSEHLQADFALRHMGSLPQPAVSAYTELDARLAWQPSRQVELSLAGQNLLHNGHVEFGPQGTRQRISRALALRMAWRY